MKLKKVVITAFRIYEKPEDATFDFETKDRGIADFVSLYAPNGFGKTSLYDAIEWGVTNSIKRFVNLKEAKNLCDTQSALNEELKLIQNSNSKRTPRVRIEFDESSRNIDESLIKHGRQKHDLLFDEKKVRNKSFQKVIRSQEWMTSFLEESDGEQRYKKFVRGDTPLHSLDRYYDNINCLEETCQDSIKAIEDRINELKPKISQKNDGTLLDTVNNQISMINLKYSDDINLFNLKSGSEQVKEINDTIAERLSTEYLESQIKENIDNITEAINGSDEVIGVDRFFENKAFEESAKSKLAYIKTLLAKFNLIKSLSTELLNLEKSKQELMHERELVERVESHFKEYSTVFESIKQQKTVRLEIQNKLSELDAQKDRLSKEEIEHNSHLESSITQLSDVDSLIATLPQLKSELETTSQEQLIIEKYLETEKPKLESINKSLNSILDTLNELGQCLKEIEDDQYSTIWFHDNLNLEQLIADITAKRTDNSNIKLQLNKLETRINNNKTLNIQIEGLIKLGLSIVNIEQMDDCPLCGQAYESFEALCKQIATNNAISVELQVMLSQKNAYLQSISKLEEDIKSLKKSISDIYREQIEKQNQEKAKLETTQKALYKAIEEKQKELNILLAKKEAFTIIMGGLEFEEYKSILRDRKEKIIQIRFEDSELLKKIRESLNNTNDSIASYPKHITYIDGEIGRLSNNESYLQITEWLKNENHSPDTSADEYLNGKKSSLINRWNSILSEISFKQNKIESLEKELHSDTKENLELEKDILLSQLQTTEPQSNSYKYFLREKLSIETGDSDKETLLEQLNSMNSSSKLQLKNLNKKREDYNLLRSYCSNILTYINSENARIELEKCENEMEIYKETVKPYIERERDRVKGVLCKKINTFFNEKLITDLYQKIDPHPDMKKIRFLVDYESSPPTLNITVVESKEKNPIIPALYFSTAQMNVLSLCVFLADALNSNDYDCIFIDDPVQSMDSINMLSTIDLLRSIVVNYEKQIILSTHDENFHNLLKMKMPPDMFKSKFMELETFGKLKKDS